VTSDSPMIQLGKTDLMISQMGIGALEWGDRIYWGYGREYTESDVNAAFSVSVDSGVNFFDTAELYGQGHSERLVGGFIRSLPPDRDPSIVVATKFFPFPWRLSKHALVTALKRSLNRLGLEKIQLYQIHWPYPPISIETWASALADVVDQGLASAVGVSNYSLSQMRRAHTVLIKRGLFLASNQVEYSLVDRRIEKNGLLKLCHDLGITCIAYSPLARGILSGKYHARNLPPGLRGRRYSAKYLTQIEPLIRLLREIGRDRESKSPVQVALNWVVCKGAVPIPGVKTLRQAQENIGALGWQLTPEEISLLDQASDQIST